MEIFESYSPDWVNVGITLIAVMIALWGAHRANVSNTKSQELEIQLNRENQRLDERVEKSTAYFNLEMQSGEIFKYESEHSAEIAPFRMRDKPAEPDWTHAGIAEQLYFQTLNLFEVCANFRRQNIVNPEVFASWVPWFFELLEGWHFRELWHGIRENYTSDVRHIFDHGHRLFLDVGGDEEPEAYLRRKEEFFIKVAGVMDCEVIRDWPHTVERELIGTPASTDHETAEVEWVKGAERAAELSTFLFDNIRTDAQYISHGEIQCGLSPDGKIWSTKLKKLLLEDLEGIDEARSVVVAARDGTICGAAIVLWQLESRTPFAVIEDMAVSSAERSGGIGTMLIGEIEKEAKKRDIDWLFLESGRRNLAAHRFFERNGFDEISHVFARRL